MHFTVLFKGITVVSSRLARTLEGNRTIAEPVEVTAVRHNWQRSYAAGAARRLDVSRIGNSPETHHR